MATKNKNLISWWLLLSMVILLLSMPPSIYADDTKATKTDAFSSAGGRVASTNYENILIVGQSSPPDVTESSSYREIGGFLASFMMITQPRLWDIMGRIGYYSNDDDVDDALVNTNGVYSDSTDVAGNYQLLGLPADDYVVRPEKENDIATAISAYDAAWILQYGVDLRDFTPYQMIAGDVSGNGSVSAYDAAKILQFGVDLINKFPVMEDNTHFWRFVPADFEIDETNWMNAPDSIVYTPLNRDTLDNYIGIIYGDVSGNWHPSEGGLAKITVATADLRLEHIYGQAGEKISLPLYLDNGPGIIAMSFTLAYNPQVLKAVGASLTPLTKDFLIAHHIAEGRIKVALAGGRAIEGSGSLVRLEFEVLETAADDAVSYFDVRDLQLNEGNLLANIQAAEFKIGTLLPEEYALQQNYPNPFNPETLIQYQLPRADHVVLTIYNSLGQEIRTLIDEEKEAGYHEIQWDGRDHQGLLVASGIYLYRLQAGQFTSIKKMLFLR